MDSVECVTVHVPLSHSMGGGAARSVDAVVAVAAAVAVADADAAVAPGAVYLVGRLSFMGFGSSAISVRLAYSCGRKS